MLILSPAQEPGLCLDLDAPIPGGQGYFKWREALWLNRWKVHVYPSPLQHSNVLEFVPKVILVRDLLGMPMHVTSWVRPVIYNIEIGGSKKSWHVFGRAIDFQVPGFTSAKRCKLIRDKILPKLDEFGLRMENIKGNWVHLDDGPVIYKRFFKP